MNIYQISGASRKIMDTYDKLLVLWGVPVEERDIRTFCGTTHVIVCGNEKNPPLVLFHGAGDDSALTWVLNARELAKHFRVYAVDTMGGFGKSLPNKNFTRGFNRLRWLDEAFDGLGIKHAFVAGVSGGAFIAQYYGTMRPERVRRMICMSRSDIISSTGKDSIKKILKVFMPEAILPTEKNVIRLIRKLAGDNYGKLTGIPIIREHYRYLLRSFNYIAMSRQMSETFSEEQLSSIRRRALFLCGESDSLIDVKNMKQSLELFRLDHRFFPGVGHLINHVIAPEINKIMIEYFSGKVIEQP